ncbi:MAG: 4Fe-4S binding protein [bacterium]
MKKIINKLVYLRPLFGLAGFIIFNSYFIGFLKGIYTGNNKRFCTPFINCHSCPSATFACPAGLIQHYLSYHHLFKIWLIPKFVIGTLVLIALIAGKAICGWICPFGTIQTLLYRLKSVKIPLSPKLHFIKYVVFIGLVVYLPVLLGAPWFCKLCPVGSLEAGVPLISFGTGSVQLREIAGNLFSIKLALLSLFLLWSVFSKRPFCRLFCPIGTIYSLFNKFSLLEVKVDDNKCIHCGKCKKLCPIENEAPLAARSVDCFLCGECVRICPTDAVKYGFRYSDLIIPRSLKPNDKQKPNKA